MSQQQRINDQQPVIYPKMLLQPTASGILVEVVSNPCEKHSTLIPVELSDQIAMAWINGRPPEVLRQLLAQRRQQEKQLLDAAGEPISSNGIAHDPPIREVSRND